MSLDPGHPRLVAAKVTRHEHYGFWVEFGEGEEGVVVIVAISDDPHTANPPYPAIGEVIEAALLGYTGPDQEARLSVRPKDISAARALDSSK